MKITKRNILFFILGFLTYFLIDMALDWDSAKKGFQEGYNDARGIESVK